MNHKHILRKVAKHWKAWHWERKQLNSIEINGCHLKRLGMDASQKALRRALDIICDDSPMALVKTLHTMKAEHKNY